MKTGLKGEIKAAFVVIAAAIALAFNYRLFIVPNDFAPAGINGIATMVQYKAGFSIGYMSLLINVPLCVLSYFLTDKRFSVRTLLFCLTYSAAYLVLQKADLTPYIYDAKGVDTVFPCLIAGMLSGAIYGACVYMGACTGGTDLVSRYISKKAPELNFFWVTFTLNAAVAAVSFFVYAREEGGRPVYDYKPVCLCLMYCFTSSFIGSTMLNGSRRAYHVTVITDRPGEIEQEIIRELRHTATRIEARGAYSHEEKSVLMCVINRHQIIDLKRILARHEGTFAYIDTVNEIMGNFKKIR